MRRGLRAEGIAVDTAVDGIDRLWKATNQAYDLIVLDVMLPGLSGYEVLKRTRAAEVWTPVLMLTAKDGEYDVGDCVRAPDCCSVNVKQPSRPVPSPAVSGLVPAWAWVECRR